MHLINGKFGESELNRTTLGKLPLIHWAAWGGRTSILNISLRFGADIDAVDPALKRTPLFFALHAGKMETAAYLVGQNADLSRFDDLGRPAGQFFHLIPTEQIEVFICLLKVPPGDTKMVRAEYPTSLYHTAGMGNVTALETLLDCHGDVYGIDEFSWAIRLATSACQVGVLEMLLPKALSRFPGLSNPFSSTGMGNIYGTMLAHGSCRREALTNTIKCLLSHGFDVDGSDRHGHTAMSMAVAKHANEPDMLTAWLDNGALLLRTTIGGRSVLTSAILAMSERENVGCVLWLLARGVSPAASEPSIDLLLSPLHIALWTGALGAVKAIIDHMPNLIDVKSNAVETPLHIACSRNLPTMIQTLLDYGADVTTTN